MDVILHDPVIQELEALLRSLKLLVERTDPRENIKIYLLYATKEELLDNFEFTPEITQSGFYKHVYSNGYGQCGGELVAAVIGSYAFQNNAADLKLLSVRSNGAATGLVHP